MKTLVRLVLGTVWLGGALQATASSEPGIDFSCVGYGAGAAVPEVPAVLRVQHVPGSVDDTALLQAAIDHVARLPLQPNGFRGAIVLDGAGGGFVVTGTLHIRASGVMLRGTLEPTSGILAVSRSRTPLIAIGNSAPPDTSAPVAVADEVVPAGAVVLTLASVDGFAAGDRVVIQRPSTMEWIAALGMDRFPGSMADRRTVWTPGSRDLIWDRTITAIDAAKQTVTLDAPITTALEQRYGGGTVAKLVGREPVRHVVVRDLELRVPIAPGEDRSWIGINLEHAEDVLVGNVGFDGFVGSAVRVGPRARRVTVHGNRASWSATELGGYRRQAFLVLGQQVLVEECRSHRGLNDFAVGHGAAGPNVFRDCTATDALGPSGSFESWASGVFYERVAIQGAGLRLARDDARAQGGGWTAANSFVRDCSATEIVVEGPPEAPVVVLPANERPVVATSANVSVRISDFSGVPLFTPPSPAPTRANDVQRPLSIDGGRFVAGGRVVWGGQLNAAWWRGQHTSTAAAHGMNITRFAPGRVGFGLTEDLPTLAERMVEQGMPYYQSIPGLWYDRRRDAHTTTAQPDANVWAPFYEMPWARSGEGTAWDGLSKYDLSQFNGWYFERLRRFGEECLQRGLVLYDHLYNSHNVYETRAHWVDYPWRPENHINATGLVDPADGGAVRLGDEVYDISHPARRELHRAYIRQHLDRLGDVPNVIFTPAFQFAGPLAFQEFLLDTVAAWERETGHDAKIALVTSKDITDAILADPQRAALVDVIDMRYWQRLADGAVWAPRGDRNRAFRDQNNEIFGRGDDTPPDTSPLFVYQAVREYRDRFPEKAIVAWHGGAGAIPVLMAGGAQALLRNPSAGQSQGMTSDAAPVDAFVREHLGSVLPRMSPRDDWLVDPDNNWCLADDDGETMLIYSLTGATVSFSRKSSSPRYDAMWIDPRSGATLLAPDALDFNAIAKPTAEAWLLFVRMVPQGRVSRAPSR